MDGTFKLEQQHLDDRLNLYIGFLARHPFTFSIKADSKNIIEELESRWPTYPEWENEALRLWNLITDLTYPFAANTQAHYVLITISAGTHLLPPSVPHDHPAILAALDADAHLLKHHFILSPDEKRNADPDMFVQTGMTIVCQTLEEMYYETHNVIEQRVHKRDSLFAWTERVWNRLYDEQKEWEKHFHSRDALADYSKVLERIRYLEMAVSADDAIGNYHDRAFAAARVQMVRDAVPALGAMTLAQTYRLPPSVQVVRHEMLRLAADEKVPARLRATLREEAHTLLDHFPAVEIADAAASTTRATPAAAPPMAKPPERTVTEVRREIAREISREANAEPIKQTAPAAMPVAATVTPQTPSSAAQPRQAAPATTQTPTQQATSAPPPRQTTTPTAQPATATVSSVVPAAIGTATLAASPPAAAAPPPVQPPAPPAAAATGAATAAPATTSAQDAGVAIVAGSAAIPAAAPPPAAAPAAAPPGTVPPPAVAPQAATAQASPITEQLKETVMRGGATYPITAAPIETQRYESPKTAQQQVAQQRRTEEPLTREAEYKSAAYVEPKTPPPVSPGDKYEAPIEPAKADTTIRLAQYTPASHAPHTIHAYEKAEPLTKIPPGVTEQRFAALREHMLRETTSKQQLITPTAEPSAKPSAAPATKMASLSPHHPKRAPHHTDPGPTLEET